MVLLKVDMKLGWASNITFASASQFHVYLPWVNVCLVYCLNSVLYVKALFLPGEGPSRSLFRYCTTSLINRFQHLSGSFTLTNRKTSQSHIPSHTHYMNPGEGHGRFSVLFMIYQMIVD